MPDGPDPYLYPDVASAGDLAWFLQPRLTAAGSLLRAQPPPAPGYARTGAEVRAGDRHASVRLGLHERVFLLDLWMRGVLMAQGQTTDPDAVAGAIALFLAGAKIRQVGAARPFIRFGSFAEAFERGEPAAIAHRWRQYLDLSSTRAPYLLNLYAFLVAASDSPRLRALFPFTSHVDLGLRESVVGGGALAWVRPSGDGLYLVATNRRDLDKPTALAPADAPRSVGLVLAALNSR